MNAMEKKVVNWLAHGEKGISSETLAFWAAFGVRVEDGMVPSDASDFNRCYQLLVAVPELREKLPKMARLSKKWGRLVARWSEVEAMLLSEVGSDWSKRPLAQGPKTCALLQKIYEKPEKIRHKAAVIPLEL